MINKLFLEALQASLKNEKVKWNHSVSREEWAALFELAETQQVLPMIYDAVFSCPAAKSSNAEIFVGVKRSVYQKVMLQAIKTEEFLKLYEHLADSGIKPILVKGLVCRHLYPKPDYRKSSDEDLLVEKDAINACHEAMLKYGMTADPDKTDVQKYDEIGYRKEGSPLYIELHRSLFSEDSDAYGNLNRYFVNVPTVTVTIGDTSVTVMEHTMHLLYLFLHAFKHFLHGGVGIRQVCDIALYANEFGSDIDWNKIFDICAEIRADRFALAIIKIGEKYFDLSYEKSGCPYEILNAEIEEQALLDDILSGGVYGGATDSRKHSSNITLNAVSAQKRGKSSRGSVVKTIFPPAKKLAGKYKYLEKYPILLPVAWLDRAVRYVRESRGEDGISEAAKIGKTRVELLKEYKVID